ncbi:hypothetical protein F2Q70_00010763 [Brassica cretica]|uniref:Uncharacterized protein n=1 Tax=Brassica cretica TaxID=69181 RepID=A0A8S9M811_BRACR|nr:hypothetical protein F2Q68_00003870 [Brassica cretica]KAF2616015.1 hypothetical protein F2Q70_00010763 [Brassica cretica]
MSDKRGSGEMHMGFCSASFRKYLFSEMRSFSPCGDPYPNHRTSRRFSRRRLFPATRSSRSRELTPVYGGLFDAIYAAFVSGGSRSSRRSYPAFDSGGSRSSRRSYPAFVSGGVGVAGFLPGISRVS